MCNWERGFIIESAVLHKHVSTVAQNGQRNEKHFLFDVETIISYVQLAKSINIGLFRYIPLQRKFQKVCSHSR